MTPKGLADLHARAMIHGKSWSPDGFASMLKDLHVFLIDLPFSSASKYLRGSARGQTAPSPTATPKAAQNLGFALGRVIGVEAELLTIVVDPSFHRLGLGQLLLKRFETEAIERNATEAFLEVSSDNTSAISLYTINGWRKVGRRKGYYSNKDGLPLDALILRKDLALI